MIGVDGRVMVHIMSGRSLLAWIVAHFGSKSANGMIVGFSFAFIALFNACHCAFWSSGGHGGLFVSSVIVTSPPDPGGSLTDWNSLSFGYFRKPGFTRPSGVPGRSGCGP